MSYFKNYLKDNEVPKIDEGYLTNEIVLMLYTHLQVAVLQECDSFIISRTKIIGTKNGNDIEYNDITYHEGTRDKRQICDKFS